MRACVCSSAGGAIFKLWQGKVASGRPPLSTQCMGNAVVPPVFCAVQQHLSSQILLIVFS